MALIEKTSVRKYEYNLCIILPLLHNRSVGHRLKEVSFLVRQNPFYKIKKSQLPL